MVSIVDDDESVRSALQGLMKVVGLPARFFASAEEFLESGQQHHTGIVGDRGSENLRQEWRQRVAGGIHRITGKPDRDDVFDVAVDCVER